MNSILTVTDNDGNKYSIVKINNQLWMAENLYVSRFRNGDTIPEAKTDEEWERAGDESNPAWCYYDNDLANGKRYGKLYNWYAVADPRGLAPEGWHIPSDEEWIQLTDNLGGEEIAGYKMKSTNGWRGEGNGTNESGFSGLPGGYRDVNGDYYPIGDYGIWWSSTEYSPRYAWNRFLHFNSGIVYVNVYYKLNGFSVRCLRD